MAECMKYHSKDFRRKLKRYSIDHTVELKILVAVLLENGISELSEIFETSEKFETSEIFKFIKYFKESWNLQILTKTEHENKGKSVLEYIRWKYGATKTKPSTAVFDQISKIFSVYNEKRDEIQKYLKSLDPNSKLYKDLEESLFNFFKTNNQNKKISIVDVIKKSDELMQTISKLNNVDHIVELQILTFVLPDKEIVPFDLAMKFVKYFHQQWNFQIMERNENNTKGQQVTEWIKVVGENSGACSDKIRDTMKKISDHYSNNIDIVKECTTTDTTTNENEKKQLHEVADYLNALFEDKIRP